MAVCERTCLRRPKKKVILKQMRKRSLKGFFEMVAMAGKQSMAHYRPTTVKRSVFRWRIRLQIDHGVASRVKAAQTTARKG